MVRDVKEVRVVAVLGDTQKYLMVAVYLFQTNLFRPCPFESKPSGQCGSRSCAVDECKDVS